MKYCKLSLFISFKNPVGPHHHKESGTKIDKCGYQWFCQVQSCQIPVPRSVLKSKVLEVTECLEIKNFKASKDWLHHFKKAKDFV